MDNVSHRAPGPKLGITVTVNLTTGNQRADKREKDNQSVHARLAFHHVDVFHLNGPAVAEVNNEDGQSDRGLCGRDR